MQVVDFIDVDFADLIIFEFFLMTTEFAEGFFKTISSSASAVSHTEAGSAEKLGIKKV